MSIVFFVFFTLRFLDSFQSLNTTLLVCTRLKEEQVISRDVCELGGKKPRLATFRKKKTPMWDKITRSTLVHRIKYCCARSIQTGSTQFVSAASASPPPHDPFYSVRFIPKSSLNAKKQEVGSVMNEDGYRRRRSSSVGPRFFPGSRGWRARPAPPLQSSVSRLSEAERSRWAALLSRMND